MANYWEALGVVAAHKAGIDPLTLRARGVSHIERLVPNGLGVRSMLGKPTLSVGSSVCTSRIAEQLS